MEHRAGKGKFTVGSRGTRVKRDPDNLHPELDAPTTFVDLWLSDNPSGSDEAAQDGISSRKTAAMIPEGQFFGPFAAEAKAIADGIKKYGSLEAFERATANVDYFADSHLVPQWVPNTVGAVSAPAGGYFESHLGSEGVKRQPLHIKKDDPSFEVTKENVERLENRHPDVKYLDMKTSDPVVIDVPQPASRLNPPPIMVVKASEVQPPSKRVRLGDDFDF